MIRFLLVIFIGLLAGMAYEDVPAFIKVMEENKELKAQNDRVDR